MGLLPLVHMNSPLLCNRLVSMPYFDHGGIIADDIDCEEKLINSAINLGRRLNIDRIELRHLNKIFCLENGKYDPAGNRLQFFSEWSVRSHKVRLLLSLPYSSEKLMKSFKSKLRSQINRPIKAGLTAKLGGIELLDDFYHVFCISMRDLGSPVHAKRLPQLVMAHFPGSARIVVVYKAGEPVAAGLMVGWKDVMINPWASALRNHSKDSPNMLLYWTMLAYAADHGFRQFDFGRSTPEEGTYRFKTQWGAQPYPMYWYTLWMNQAKEANQMSTESKKKALLINLWRRLPVPITRVIGPAIRKHIDL